MSTAGGLGLDGSSKKISRVESLKNLILHGKIEPDLPPDVFNYPYCSCRWPPQYMDQLILDHNTQTHFIQTIYINT